MPIPMLRPARRLGATLLLAGAAFASLQPQARAEDEATFLKESAAFFEQQSKQLPLQVDQVTRLENVRLDTDSKVLHYRYGISSMKAEGMQASDLDKFKGEQRTRLERATCQQPALLQRIREHGIRVAHDYDGSDGKPLASIEIDPQKLQCQG